MKQEYSSKYTSINSKKIPAIYNKINWDALKTNLNKTKLSLLDYGAGRFTDHIKNFCEERGIEYYWYDPNTTPVCNYLPDTVFDVVVCSNVLNVIKEDKIVAEIHKDIVCMNKPYFFSIYEGNRSGISKRTKPDCWQRNEKIEKYAQQDEKIRKNVLTKQDYVQYIK